MIQLNIAPTISDANGIFPKVHAREDGTFDLINTLPDEIDKFLYELPSGEWPVGRNLYKASGAEGSIVLVITISDIEQVGYVTSLGSEYSGANLWVNIFLPEPVESGGEMVWPFSNTDLVEDRSEFFTNHFYGDKEQAVEMENGDVVFLQAALRVNPDTLDIIYNENVLISSSSFNRPVTYTGEDFSPATAPVSAWLET